MAQLIKLLNENKKLKDKVTQYEQVYGCCPHVDDSLLKGGYRVVKTVADRDSIPCCYRKKGMRVVVIEDESPYTEYRLLSSDCKQNQWEAITSNLQVFEENVKFKEGYENDEEEELLTQKQLNEYLYDKLNSLTLEHNELDGLQGGQPGEYYHFTESQHERVLDLIYINGTSVISVSPSSGERGVNIPLTVSYTITPNDDIYGTASINQGIGDVTANIDGNSHSISGGSSIINKSFILTLNYTRQGNSETETKTTTYTAHIPQWAGWSIKDDFSTYSEITTETNLQKFIQSSASINKATSPTNEYIWFISNKNNATIRDTNDFVQTIGTWNDGVSEFYSKSLSLTLADGTTTATVYLYRSRNTKTLTSFIYKIS